MTPRFNLKRQFGLFSFINITLIAAITGYSLSTFLTEKMLLREATLTQEFIDSIIQTDNIWQYFLLKEEAHSNPEFQFFFQHLSNMPDVIYAKIYSANQNVLWANDHTLIGHNDDNDDLATALNGELVSEFGIVGDEKKKEHAYMRGLKKNIHFVETYIPVWDPDHKLVVGAVELYKQPRMLHDAIIQGQFLIWSIALIGALILYLSLYWLIARAEKIMHNQQERLIESRSLAMIGETASAVAHAMRNTLSSIRAAAELTLDDDLEGAHESARDIIVETDRLNRWALELLKFSGDGRNNLDNLNLISLVKEVVDEHVDIVKKCKISLKLSFPDQAIYVKASKIPLSQAFGNLIMNAIEAMEEGGKLSVSIYRSKKENDTICVSISDTGPGLSTDIAQQLFKPFATSKPNGTGLGLALTRRLLQHYGGTVSIESETGKGVTATIMLPVSEASF